MKLTIYVDTSELSQSQLRAIENVAVAHDATLEQAIKMGPDGGKLFTIDPVEMSPQDVLEIDDVCDEIERAIAKFS